MQAVIIHDDIHNPVAVIVVHLEQVHRRIVHAQQVVDACCIHGRQVVVMHRNFLGKRGCTEVEHIAFVIVLHIREKADETAQFHHKHQMEIGKLLAAPVQPLQAVHHKLVKIRVALFVARAVIDKLGEEKQYAQLRGVEGNGGEGNAYSRIAYMVQLLFRPDVEFQVEYRQRLEKLLLQFGMPTTHDSRPSCSVRKSTMSLFSPYFIVRSTTACVFTSMLTKVRISENNAK